MKPYDSDQRQVFLLELGDALRPLADAAAIEVEACRLLGEALDVDRAYYVEINEDRNEAYVSQNYLRGDSSSLEGTHRASDFGWVLEAMRSGEILVINDAQHSERIPEAERPAMAATCIAAHANVPLLKEGRLVGALCVTECAPRQWTGADIELLREAAERIWATIERARAEAALRASEGKYRDLIEAMQEGFCIMELIPDGKGGVEDIFYREANPAYARHTGLHDIVDKKASELFPHLEPRWLRTMARVLETGEPVRLEGYQEDLGRWFSVQYARIGGADSRLVGVVFDDITERKRTEQTRRESEKRQAFLLKLNDALRDEYEPADVGRTATRMLARHMGVDRSYICRLSHRETLAWVEHEYHAPGLVSAAGEYHFDDFPESLRGSEEESMAIDDLRNDTHLTGHDKRIIESMGMHAVLTGILRKDGRDRVWALVAGDSRPRAWSKADREVIEEATERTWTAMQRSRAESALRENETRYRSVVESATDGIWLADQAGNFIEVNSAACRMLGYSPDQHRRLNIRDIIKPDEEPLLRALLETLKHGGQSTEIWMIRHADGHYVPIESSQTFTPGGYWQIIGRDVSERQRVERELQHRSEQYVTLLRESPLGVYLVDRGFRVRVINPAARETAGIVGNLEGQDFDRVMHNLWPHDYANELVRCVRHTMTTRESCFIAERPERPDTDTAWYTWHIHRTAIPDDGDGVVCYLSDITDQVHARERQKLLLMEINHRVKNTLATVQSIATQSLRNANTLEEGGATLESRLISLSKAHDVLTREHWEGGDLNEVVENTLCAYPDKAGASRFHVSGVAVRLKPKAVVSLSMALHELATNAIKYGALSGENGYVDIAWEIDGAAPDRRFHMRWSEHGGPLVHAPKRRGFGSRLIEQGLAMDMGGEVRLDFDPDGLVCTIDAPLGEISSEGRGPIS